MPVRNLSQIVLDWNKRYPVGTSVYVTINDEGARIVRKIKKEACVLNGRKAVVWIDGIRDPYDLDMVRPVKKR